MASQEKMARRITEERRAIRARLREIDQRSSGGNPQDLFEQAQQDFMKEQEAREYERLTARAKALDWAWESLQQGTYGICQLCGEVIPQRRLEVVPDAVFCTACQEQVEHAARSPGAPGSHRLRAILRDVEWVIDR